MAMTDQSKISEIRGAQRRIDGSFDFETLLHPARGFSHPLDVVRDADLTLNEKRAILASWASDACAVEAAPELRCPLGSGKCVRFDDIMDALRTLDRQAREQHTPEPHYRRVIGRRLRDVFKGHGRGVRDQKSSVN
jgi:hypothetical protein